MRRLRTTTSRLARGITISCARRCEEIAAARRYNLQETLAHELFDRIAAIRGVRDLRIRTSKPDVYAEAAGVGVEIASFSGAWPKE